MRKIVCGCLAALLLLTFAGCSVRDQEKRDMQDKFNDGYEHINNDEEEADQYFEAKK